MPELRSLETAQRREYHRIAITIESLIIDRLGLVDYRGLDHRYPESAAKAIGVLRCVSDCGVDPIARFSGDILLGLDPSTATTKSISYGKYDSHIQN